jgi:hypothetical protein
MIGSWLPFDFTCRLQDHINGTLSFDEGHIAFIPSSMLSTSTTLAALASGLTGKCLALGHLPRPRSSLVALHLS